MKQKTAAQIREIMKSLPDMQLTETEFAEEFRKLCRNASVRFDPESEHDTHIVKWLIYFDKQVGIPKAAMIKDCLHQFADATFLKKISAGKGAEACYKSYDSTLVSPKS